MEHSQQPKGSVPASKPQVVMTFPGVGKTWLTKRRGTVRELDADDPEYVRRAKDIKEEGNLKLKALKLLVQDFTELYDNPGNVTHILIDSSDYVRDRLLERGIPFMLIYPTKALRDEYADRWRACGHMEPRVEHMEVLYDVFGPRVEDFRDDSGLVTKIEILEPGLYLDNILWPFSDAV